MSTDCEMATFSWWLVQSDGKNRQILRLCSCSLLEPVLICCSCELLDGSPSLSWVMVTMHKIKTSPEINPAHLCLIDLDFQAANCSFSALELSRTSVFPTIFVKECRFKAGNQRSDEMSVQSAMLRIVLKCIGNSWECCGKMPTGGLLECLVLFFCMSFYVTGTILKPLKLLLLSHYTSSETHNGLNRSQRSRDKPEWAARGGERSHRCCSEQFQPELSQTRG